MKDGLTIDWYFTGRLSPEDREIASTTISEVCESFEDAMLSSAYEHLREELSAAGFEEIEVEIRIHG
jgi:hypothetical protein